MPGCAGFLGRGSDVRLRLPSESLPGKSGGAGWNQRPACGKMAEILALGGQKEGHFPAFPLRRNRRRDKSVKKRRKAPENGRCGVDGSQGAE